MMTQPQHAQLRDFIIEHFSREELFTFCADNFRDFYRDNEGSSATKTALARGLVDYCEQHGSLDLLMTNLQRTREQPYLAQLKQFAEEHKQQSATAIQQTTSTSRISRRTVMLGIGGAAGIGALAWAIGKFAPARIASPVAPNTPSPFIKTATTTTQTPKPVSTNTSSPTTTTVPLPAGLPATLSLTSPIAMDLVLIPSGPFLMGSDKTKDNQAYDVELPQHTLTLNDYYIGKYEVTNEQWALFAQANGRAFSIPNNKAKHPMVSVNWHDAQAFCDWLGKSVGRKAMLPSEAEWEKAARGTDGRIYPWGNDAPTKNLLNVNGSVGDTTPVGQYSPQGDSPYGCADMAGNVAEWTRSLWGKGVITPDFTYPYVVNGEREDLRATDDVRRVMRGGSWNGNGGVERTTARDSNAPPYFYINLGFRVVLSAT